jgi:hypothetical protein
MADYLEDKHPGQPKVDIGSNRSRVFSAGANWWGLCPDILTGDPARISRYSRFGDYVGGPNAATWCTCRLGKCLHQPARPVYMSMFSAWYLQESEVAQAIDSGVAFYAVIHDFDTLCGSIYGEEASWEVSLRGSVPWVRMYVRGNDHAYEHPIPDWLLAGFSYRGSHYTPTTLKRFPHCRLLRFMRSAAPPVYRRPPGLAPSPNSVYGSLFVGTSRVNAPAVVQTLQFESVWASLLGLGYVRGSSVLVSSAVVAKYATWMAGRPRSKEVEAALKDHVLGAYDLLVWPDSSRAESVAVTVELCMTTGLAAERRAIAILQQAKTEIALLAKEREAAFSPAPTSWWWRLLAHLGIYEDGPSAKAAMAGLAVAMTLLVVGPALRRLRALGPLAVTAMAPTELDALLAIAVAYWRRDALSWWCAGTLTTAVLAVQSGHAGGGLQMALSGLTAALMEENLKRLGPWWLTGPAFALFESAGQGGLAWRLPAHSLLAALPYSWSIWAHTGWNNFLLPPPVACPAVPSSRILASRLMETRRNARVLISSLSQLVIFKGLFENRGPAVLRLFSSTVHAAVTPWRLVMVCFRFLVRFYSSPLVEFRAAYARGQAAGDVFWAGVGGALLRAWNALPQLQRLVLSPFQEVLDYCPGTMPARPTAGNAPPASDRARPTIVVGRGSPRGLALFTSLASSPTSLASALITHSIRRRNVC